MQQQALEWMQLSQGHSHFLIVSLSAAWLAWSSEQGCFRLALPGDPATLPPGERLSFAAVETLGPQRASCLAIAGETVAWAEADAGPLVLWQAGQRHSLAQDDLVWSLLNDGRELIWSSVRLINGNALNQLGAIRRIGLAGGAADTLAEGLYLPDGLCRDAYGKLWFAAGPDLMRLDPDTLACQRLYTQPDDLTGPILTSETLIWSDGAIHESLLLAPLPAPGEPLATPQVFSPCRDTVIGISAAPAGAVWIETPGYDDPYTLRAQGLNQAGPVDLSLPGRQEPASVACNQAWIACASTAGTVWLAPLPAWLRP